ncbi:hypothetical protein L4C36_23285, partial [Photobacterium japonica]|uniref:hypothetical protein n=1 Tax=Photobacterium japonica TaxID=2910235 RepID=UPI003D11105A
SNKVFYRFQQMLFLLNLFFVLKEGGYRKCIFLSYENLTMLPFSYFLKNVSVIEHNNIDQLLTSKFKSFAYSYTSSKVEHFVFEDYIGEYISKKYNKNYNVLAHPERKIQSIKEKKFDKEYVFCPSGDVSYEFLLKLCQFCKQNDYLLIAKDKYNLTGKCDVIQKSFFEDYDSLFINSKFIAIGVEFSYRISGVFYEAIANHKKVIMNECVFSSNVQSKYINNIEMVL